MRPKIIIFSTAYHPLIGGAEISIQEVVKRLQNRFDFYILTHRAKRDLPKKESRGGATIFRLGFGTVLDRWFIFPILTFWRARGILKESKTPVLLWPIMVSYASIGAYLLKRMRPQLPLVLTLQEGDSEEYLRTAKYGLVNFWWKRLLGVADEVTAISTYLGEYARRQGYLGRIRIIPNGVDIGKFQIPNNQNSKSKTIITTSRLVPKNGIDILIQAIAELKKIIPDIRCNIIGDGPEKKNYELIVKNYELGENIKLLGEIPHEKIPPYLHQADIFVRPSRSEGMGNSFVEALAAGLPIIGTAVGGITDIIQDGRTGLLAKVNDSEDLAEKIKILLSDQALREKIVVEGGKLVREKFDWDIISESYASIFSDKAGGCSPDELCVLMVSTDENILRQGTEAHQRIRFYAKAFRKLEVAVVGGPGSVLWKRIRLYGVIASFCRQERFNIVSAQSPDEIGLIAYLAARRFHIPLQLQIHTDIFSPFYRNAGWKEWVRYRIALFLISRADCIRVVSERVRRSIDRVLLQTKSTTRRGRLSLPPVKVLSIFTDVSKFSTAISDSKTEERFQGYSFRMVAVGRFVEKEKNFLMLIGMMRDFVKICPDALLVLVGDGPDKESYKLQVTSYKLEKNVIIEPWRDDLPSFLKSFHLFLLSSNYEGWGRVVIEAMAAGLPVVMTDVGLAGEVVRNGENGIVVPVADKEEFYKACVRLHKNPDLRAKFAREGQITLGSISDKNPTEYLEKYKKSWSSCTQ